MRQLIVSKYAVNSLDIHYILAKVSDLAKLYDELYQTVKTFLSQKGDILREFQDLGDAS